MSQPVGPEIIVRDVFLDRIRPALRKSWRVEKTQRTIGKLSRVTLVIRQVRIERDPEVPKSNRRVYFELVLASPLDETGAAELELDDEIVTFLTALDGAVNVRWESAIKGIWSDQNPAPVYVVSAYMTYSLIRKEE